VPVTAVPERLSDAELIAAVRRGDTQAYGELYERHLAAANRAAAYLVGTTAEREDLVAEAFTRVLQVLRTGRGPAHDFRPYLLVTMRHAAINAARRSPSTALYADLPDAYLRGATDDPVDARLTGNEAASAFAGLPERWRQVLWHTEVEGASPAAIAPMLGLTPNGVAALAYRAREGLRQAYLRMHLPAVDQRDCRAATDKLAGWVRRSISEPQHRKISAHLRTCPRCRELAAGLSEVNGDLKVDVGPAMSWLSVFKGAFSATAVKIGAAAAIAAVAAVGIVTSEPGTADKDPALADPTRLLPNTPLDSGAGQLRTNPLPVSDAATAAGDTPPTFANAHQGSAANEQTAKPPKAKPPQANAEQASAGQQNKATASTRGKHAGNPNAPAATGQPASAGQSGVPAQPVAAAKHAKK
jgi:RNA polymerase sigma factor (sigma-70 family)